MSLLQFLKSKVFFKQIAFLIIGLVILCFLVLQYLKFSTNHGQFIAVPELKGKTLDVVEIELDDATLNMVIQDSANYNPNYPPYSVIEQAPKAGAFVKENRKIYLTLNPSGYRKVAVPNVVRRTFRQAKPTLEAIGFEIGELSYVDDIGKDEVIGIKHDGKELRVGDLLPKTSKIDLVLGNGNRPSRN
ncbi:MAG: PASTA domain-containing protein [bacterium]